MARILGLLLLTISAALHMAAATASTANKKSASRQPAARAAASSKKAPARKASAKQARAASSTKRSPARARVRKAAYNPWTEPSFGDSTIGDSIDGDDLTVRRAAVEALGPFNGAVVVADPNTGRILTIVNQKLAYKSGFIPCSTIKVVVGLAALSEGLIERSTPLRINRREKLDLTQALATSNNPFFAQLGQKLGFEKVTYYARLLGLGEKATLGLDEEQPGQLPPAPPKFGGMGMMCSFGEGITLTPLQLAAALSALANGGTLYYLQYPKSAAEAEAFVPRIKRQLDIAPWIPEIKPGMMGAVAYGTAQRAGFDPNEPILGKTGTCTDRNSPTHLGWFGSFNDVEKNNLVVVVLLTGGRHVNGPVASGVAGEIYRRLAGQRYFAQNRQTSPVQLVDEE
jgi:cell division protein FtsI/penicillin-binding protein 2